MVCWEVGCSSSESGSHPRQVAQPLALQLDRFFHGSPSMLDSVSLKPHNRGWDNVLMISAPSASPSVAWQLGAPAGACVHHDSDQTNGDNVL